MQHHQGEYEDSDPVAANCFQHKGAIQ
jgi:hypothetical protein